MGNTEIMRTMDFKELEVWGEFAIKSGILPVEKVGEKYIPITKEKAMAIVATGNEMGLHPFQSLRCMSFVKGRLCMKVELQLALAKNRGVTIDKVEEKPGYCAITLKRGKELICCPWTKEMAVKAQLVKTDGNWDKYEKQMLRWRSTGDGLRLIAPDLTMGLLDPVEAETLPMIDATCEIVGKPEVTQPVSTDQPPEPEPTTEEPKLTEENIKTLKELCKKRAVGIEEILKKLEVPELETLTKTQGNLILAELKNYQIVEK